MKLVIDSNIVIDFLAQRRPFFDSAAKLMTLIYLHEFEAFFSISQASDIFYVLTHGRCKISQQEAKVRIRKLRGFVDVCPLGSVEFDAALNSSWQDFEDACVYQAARSIRADAIITRNQADFEESSIKVFSCEEFFDWLEDEEGVVYEEVDL